MRGHARSEAELKFVQNLGNGSVQTQEKTKKTQKKKMIALRDDNGDRMSQDHQAAIIGAMQDLEDEQDHAYEVRDVIAEKMDKTMRRIAEIDEKIRGIEQDNAGIEMHSKELKSEIAKAQNERDQNLAALETIRSENDVIKSRTLMGLDVQLHKLRQELRDTDKALKNAIWSSGWRRTSNEKPESLVESAFVSPVRRRRREPLFSQTETTSISAESSSFLRSKSCQSIGVLQSLRMNGLRDTKKNRGERKNQQHKLLHTKANAVASRYGALAAMSLKDIGEIDIVTTAPETTTFSLMSRQPLQSPPQIEEESSPFAATTLSSCVSMSTNSTSLPAFRTGTPKLPTPYSEIGSIASRLERNRFTSSTTTPPSAETTSRRISTASRVRTASSCGVVSMRRRPL